MNVDRDEMRVAPNPSDEDVRELFESRELLDAELAFVVGGIAEAVDAGGGCCCKCCCKCCS